MTNASEMTVETALKNIAAALGVSQPSTLVFGNPRATLTNVVNKAIANGSPVVIERSNLNVTPEGCAQRRAIITSYAPHDTTDAFAQGFIDFTEGRFVTVNQKSDPVGYDCGRKAAARCIRAGC